MMQTFLKAKFRVQTTRTVCINKERS